MLAKLPRFILSGLGCWCVATTQPAFAAPTEQTGLWLNAIKSGGISNSDWVYSVSAENRSYDAQTSGNLYDLSGFLGHRISTGQILSAGYQYFHSYTSPSQGGKNENQYHQLWDVRFPLDKNTLIFTQRLVERQRQGLAGINWVWREKLQYEHPLVKNKLVVSDEIFLNLNHPEWVNSNVAEQNRLFIGISIPATTNTDLLVGYLNRYVVQDSTDIMQNILSMTLAIH